LKTGTAAEKARFNDLSANIVSTYRECLLHPSVPNFSLSDSFFCSFIFSTPEGGCAAGALCSYFIGHYLGRKWGLFACALVFCVGAVLQIVASSSTGLGIMYAGRFIVGWGVGVASSLTVSGRGLLPLPRTGEIRSRDIV
jgi:MFS family permease